MKPRRTPSDNAAMLSKRDYQRLWRMVEGQVIDCLNQHPEYATDYGMWSLPNGITKRVVGQLIATFGSALADVRDSGPGGESGSLAAVGKCSQPTRPGGPVPLLAATRKD